MHLIKKVVTIIGFTIICVNANAENFADYYNIDQKTIELIVESLPDQDSREIAFYSAIIPPHINLNSSFVVVGDKGSGKTALWRWLKSKEKDASISEGKVLIAEPFSDKTFFENALQEFGKNKKGTEEGADEFKKSWSKEDMLNFVFSRIASDVLVNLTEKYHFARKNNLGSVLDINKLDESQKEALFTLTCFYYYDHSNAKIDSNSKRFIDLAKILGLVDKTSNESDNWYEEFPSNIDDGGSLYGELKDLSEEILVFNKEKNQEKLKFLSYISQQINVNPLQFLGEYTKKIDSPKFFVEYLKLLRIIGLSVKIAVDSLDEVDQLGVELVDGSSCIANDGFITIVQSLSSLIKVAEGEKQYIKLFLFIPLCNNVGEVIQQKMVSQDKTNYHNLDWEKDDLSQYGDFSLGFLKSKQKNLSCGYIFCNKLPDTFAEFLGGSNCEKRFLENVTNPRTFNRLFSHFIAVLNAGNHAKYGFIGDPKCLFVDSAIKKFHKDTGIKSNSNVSNDEHNNGHSDL